MKKYFLLAILFLAVAFVSAEGCAPNITLLNQDPYPAVPGDYVKLVFQIKDISGADCNDMTFKLVEKYPLIFDPLESGIRTFSKVDYLKDYDSNVLVPIKVRIDENALDGTNPIEVSLQNKGFFTISKTFDIEVEDTHTSFEIFVENYNPTTGAFTLQILNTGDSNIEALTVEIPKQDDIIVKGANRVIVGDLDSNEYTTADFEAKPQSDNFKVNLIYSDNINIRRTALVDVLFDSEYFQNKFSDQTTTSVWTYIIWLIIIFVVVWIIFKFVKKRKSKK